MLKQFNTGENNVVFSQTLLKSYEYSNFNCNGTPSIPTINGHGPFCKMDDGQCLFDLRLHVSPFGYSHPLTLRAKLINTEKMSQNYDQLINEIKLKAEYIFKNKPSCIFSASTDIYTFLNQVSPNAIILNDNTSNNLVSELKKIKNNQDIILHITPQIYKHGKSALYDLFDAINQLKQNIFIIEDNLLGTCDIPLISNTFLKIVPKMIFSNLSTPSFLGWNTPTFVPHHLDIKNLAETYLFLNFMHEIHFWETNGRLNHIQQQIKKSFPLNSLGNYIFVNKSECFVNTKQIQLNGVLCNESDDLFIFKIPISIKNSHIEHIMTIIKNITRI